MAKPPVNKKPIGPAERFEDAWRTGAVNSVWGAGGLVNLLLRGKGVSQKEINQRKADYNKKQEQKYSNDPIFKVRPGHKLDYVSPENIGRATTTLLGHLLGGPDPSWLVGGEGVNMAARALDMAGLQGAASIGRQQTEKNLGQRKKLSGKQVAADMAISTAIQGAHEVGRALRTVRPTMTGNEVVPFKAPRGKDGLPPRGEFASQKEAAMHMRAKGHTQATHDIVAHGDNSYSVKEKVPTTFQTDDSHVMSEPPVTEAPVAEVPAGKTEIQDVHADDFVPTEAPTPDAPAPTAPDGMPLGNVGGVPPISPRDLAGIMGDPNAAGINGVNDNAPNRRMNNRDRMMPEATDADLANLPPANREFLEQQSHLTPAEAQEMDASVPKPMVQGLDPRATPDNMPAGNDNTQLSSDDMNDAMMNAQGYVRSVVDGRWLTRDEAYEEAHQQWVNKNFPEGTEVRGYGHNIDEHGNYKPDDVVKAIEDQDSEMARFRDRRPTRHPLDSDYWMKPEEMDIASDDLGRKRAIDLAEKHGLSPKGISDLLYNVELPPIPRDLFENMQEFNTDHLSDIIGKLNEGKPFDLNEELARKGEFEGHEDPNAPQYDEIIRSQPGVNARRMAKMLGPQLYGDPSNMGEVSVKEVLQNSFDAIKDAMTHNGITKGKIDIYTDKNNRTIQMRDNGIGMKPETLGGKFLQIAGSGKEGDNSSGGFGIAKMLFLYGNKDLNVITMRDGKVSELNATGEQLFDSLEDPNAAPDIVVRDPTPEDHKIFPHGHGTYIRMTIPKNFKDPMTGEMKDIEFPQHEWEFPSLTRSPLFRDVDVNLNDYPVEGVGSKFPKEDFKPFANVKFQWGDADVYVSKVHKKSYGDNVHHLSNGLFQFTETMPKDPKNPWGDAIPYTFYIDLHPTVKPDEAGYPFSFNRQSLTEQAKEEVGHVKSYIQKLYGAKSVKDEAKSFGQMYYIDPTTGEHSELHDLTPDIPVHEDGFRGIQEGDNVEIKDGRMIVNGEDMPILTPDKLKGEVITADKLMVDPKLIDPNRIMVHDNTIVDFSKQVAQRKSKSYQDALETPDAGPPQKLTDHMREKFGEDFDNLVHTAGQSFMELRNMVSMLEGKDIDYGGLQTEAIGVSFDPKYHGVSIRVPFSGSFINPILVRGETATEKAYAMIGTMIHELAHHKVRSHNADFPAEMQQIMFKLHSDPRLGYDVWQKNVADALAQYEDIIDYGRKLYDEGHAVAHSDSFKDGQRDEVTGGSNEGDAGRVPDTGKTGQGSEGVSPSFDERYPTVEAGEPVGDPSSRAGKKAILTKLKNVLEAGKPLRAETQAAISKERGERIRKVYEARAKRGGEAGFYDELAKLKGEMDKARIQSIRPNFSQEEIDAIFDIVKNNPKLAGYDSINAQTALKKLFGKDYGELPTESEAKLLAKALPKSVIYALMKDEEGSASIEWLDKYADPAAEVLGIPRSVKASLDIGAALRQGIPMIGTKEYWKALPELIKGMASEKMYQKSMDEIYTDPDYHWMQVGKVAFTHIDSMDISDKDEAFPGHLAHMIPGVRRSERSYTGFLNVLRYHAFKRLLQEARNMGLDPTGDDKYLKQLGDFVNTMTGRGSLGKTGDKAAPFLSSLFFSPRLAASRAQMLNPHWYYKLPPQLKREAARSIAAYSTYMGVVLGISAAMGAKVVMDPRSTDFAKVMIKNTRWDPSGGLQPFVRTFWQFITNSKKNASGQVQKLGQKYGQPTRLDLVVNFIEGKASPNAAFLMDMMRGKDIAHPKNVAGEVHPFSEFMEGNTITQKLNSTAKNPVVNLVVPMVAGSTLEAGAEYGWKDLIPYAAFLTDEMGIGTNTYSPRKPKSRKKGPYDSGFGDDKYGGGGYGDK